MKPIDWEAAITIRRSVRSYERRQVADKTLASLREFVSSIEVPFQHDVKIRFFKAYPDRRLYNTLRMTPLDGMAFIARTDIPSIATAGFVGEMAILYATTLGLATCWYGHYALAELERLMPYLEANESLSKPKWGYGSGVVPGERAICITPLGYWRQEGLRLLDRTTESLMSYKRKPISAFLEGGIPDPEENLRPEILYAFDLARKAPSAANSQHWRFLVSIDQKTIAITMPVGYQHLKWEHPDVDIGICACHFWLGLIIKKVACRVWLSEEQGRAVWRFEV